MDPESAQAWASEAQAILLFSDSGSSYGDIPAAEVERLARPLMERAYELAPTEPLVLAVYGLLESQADNFQLANEFYDRSLAIEPNSGEVMNWKRLNLIPAGRAGEAQSLVLRMIEADPMSRITLLNGIASIARFGDGTPELVDSLLNSSLFERLSGNLQFQTVIARMRELAAQERSEVLDLLCGPDQLEGWDPAPDTCTLWAEGRNPLSEEQLTCVILPPAAFCTVYISDVTKLDDYGFQHAQIFGSSNKSATPIAPGHPAGAATCSPGDGPGSRGNARTGPTGMVQLRVRGGRGK